MKVSIFAYTKAGCELAGRIAAFMEANCEGKMADIMSGDISCYTTDRIFDDVLAKETTGKNSCIEECEFFRIEKPAEAFYGQLFLDSDIMIFVGATGIAVREIAPHVKDKTTDPAVISIDERGEHIIPILSGHIGGANEFARCLAEELGGDAIITTATDINKRFSVDSWAASQGFIIDDMETAKAVSAKILEGDIPLFSDLPVSGTAPGIVLSREGDIGIYVGWRREKPFKRTLNIIPRALHVGIGCRKGIEKNAIVKLFQKVFEEESLDERAVKSIASIDIKSDEDGLLSFASENNLAIEFYSAEELNGVEGDFSSSSFVAEVTGVDNVCERAAVKAAGENSGENAEPVLVVKKTLAEGVTIAVAAEYTEVNLG